LGHFSYSRRSFMSRTIISYVGKLACGLAVVMVLAGLGGPANRAHGDIMVTLTHADSLADWDAALIGGASPTVVEQGGLNWRYGFYATADAPATFTELETFTGTYWVPSAAQKTGGTANSNPRVGKTDMHPGYDGSLVNTWAVRRWTSTATGLMNLAGTVGRTQTGSGDGTTIRFYLNGTQLLSEAIALPGGNDITPQSFDFDLILAEGDVLDFAVDDNANPFFDNTLFNVLITQQIAVPEPTSVALLSGMLALVAVGRRRARGLNQQREKLAL